MASSLTDEWTERFRESRIGRDVFGPKIARPLAAWLDENFGDEPSAGEAAEAGEVGETVEASAPQPVAGDDTNGSAASQQVAPIGANAAHDELAVDELGEIDLTPTSVAGLKGTLREVAARIKIHNLVVVAAGIAFWGLLAIPATLFAVVSIAGLVLDPATVKQQVSDNLTGLPEEAQEIIGGQLESVSGGSTGGLIAGLVVGLILALWTASGAMAKMMGALNTIYETPESRNFLKLRGTALALTFGGIVFISSAIFLLAALPPLLSSIDGIGEGAASLFVWLRFPVLGVVMIVALGVLYHLGPNRRTTYRPLTVGALVAMLLWLGLSGLFTVYTSTVGSYNETYGSIGGIVILLLWLFITAFVVLLGAEIHSQSESQARSSQD